jgi:hypothetical protein
VLVTAGRRQARGWRARGRVADADGLADDRLEIADDRDAAQARQIRAGAGQHARRSAPVSPSCPHSPSLPPPTGPPCRQDGILGRQ